MELSASKKIFWCLLLDILPLSKSKYFLLPYAVEHPSIRIDSDVHVWDNYVVEMPCFLVLQKKTCHDFFKVLKLWLWPGRRCRASTLCWGLSLSNTSAGLSRELLRSCKMTTSLCLNLQPLTLARFLKKRL